MTHQHRVGIRELASKYNCSFRTLRFYEEQGLLAPLRLGRQRLYDDREEAKLASILRSKRLGLSLQEVRRLILDEKTARNTPDRADVDPAALLPREKAHDQIAILTDRRAQIDAALAELKSAQARFSTEADSVKA